ncbi:MAG: hypothetical protein F4X40_07805 [Chloroflexi bacterium]|nr:hypothetical protein [Chloroflexota bacterium]
MTPLENRLVLHRFLCREFGYGDFASMLERMRNVPPGSHAGGESEYAKALYLNPDRAGMSSDCFADYDAEITALSRRLCMTVEHGRAWKPHQWLALLFAEHYLRRYFEDVEALRDALNDAKGQDPLTRRMPDYTAADLRNVAVQSATGSGKTLVMHAHILQYRRLACAAGKPPNNVILVTPNEQLSVQHERALRASNLPARLFSSEARADLLAPVEIIDLNKLAEKKGIKRVAVSDFGDNNLVLVDEGHLGASGKVWRERRTELARRGFAFEYSATFNQIVAKDDGLRDAYGKCLMFDYPYRAFHRDGYGKDYAISNLPQGAEDENSDMYLLGCLLSFYQQCRIWRAGHADWTDFNVTRPLWVFLGKTVTGKSGADEATKSDVVRILNFLGRVLAHSDAARSMIARLLADESGLTDDAGADFFAGRFDDLKGSGTSALYDDICETLFHGPGQLHVRYLTQGGGELHLRTAENAPFGVVNIGDSAALYRLLTEAGNRDLAVEREAGFARRLFADVDRADSTVNIVIGARRFIAGWNSWRVSTMGLMHVGVGEGPEIIQMFGRGVRLKGWNMSLKRHRESGAEPPVDSHRLAELETLRIFGLRANYMQTFRELLEQDGISVERTTVALPVTWNFARKDLKIFRLEKGLEYGRSMDRPVLGEHAGIQEPVVEMDLYSRLQAVESGNRHVIPAADRAPVKLEPHHVVLFDRARIYRELLARKQQKNWHNLLITPAAIDNLLERNDWYTLYLPPERLTIRSYANLQRLEGIVVELISDYVAQFWQRRRAGWEHERIEVTTLEEHDENNIGMYELSVDSREERLIEDLQTLVSSLTERTDHRLKLGLLIRDSVAYKPLLYATGEGQVTVQPVPLDANEKQVVERLGGLAEASDPCLQGRELFLIRNLTRGRGVSFFDDRAYFPDFIIWLVGGQRQTKMISLLIK